MQLLHFLFKSSRGQLDAALLIIRLTIGFMMSWHGWGKLSNFEVYAGQFPDPIGLGVNLSLSLVIFAELFGGLTLISGFLVRFFAVNIFIAMAVAVFVVHAQDPFEVKELAAVFMFTSFSLMICGSGKYSIDNLIDNKLTK